jgi:hypothetical protein
MQSALPDAMQVNMQTRAYRVPAWDIGSTINMQIKRL